MMRSSDARSLSLFFQRAFLSTDIRKIRNTSGEQETAENTRWRIMIRCDVLNFFFFRILGTCKSVHFSNHLSLSLSSENRRLGHLLPEKERLLFFQLVVVADTIRALFFSFFFHFYVNSDGTSYAQAMCSPKLNPLIVSGTDFLPSSRFFEKCGLAREGVPFAQSRAFSFSRATKKPRGEVYPPIGFLFLFLSRALTPHRSFFCFSFRNRSTAKVHHDSRLGLHVYLARGQDGADHRAGGSRATSGFDRGEPGELREEAGGWGWRECAAAVRGTAVWSE